MSNGSRPDAEQMSSGPLAGIRVVDLTIARAGPTCVRQLADLGADVIRIANPRGGDLGGSDALNLHRNKRSIVLDLKREEGRAILLRLVRDADVFVENFRAGVKHRLRIDYETLRTENSRLIYASLSGFGQEGPYAERPAVDQIIQGMSGLMSVTGPPGQGPWRTGLAISDSTAGTFLAQGVLAALFARERSGEGQWVHTSLLEALLNFMDFQAARWLNEGVVPEQEGNDHPTIFPMGAFRAADGWINIAPALHFDRFVEVLGVVHWLEDARFADMPARTANREALRSEIEAQLAKRSCAQWVELLNDAGIAAGPILDVAGAFADPQVEHLRMSETVVHERVGEQRVLRSPLNFSSTPTSIRSAAPLADAHTDEILREAGYDAAEIATLRASGIAGQGGGGGAQAGGSWNES